jgi:hypothetical protein
MKLYRARVPAIAHRVIEQLCNDGSIDVDVDDRKEAERDLEAIMESFLQRDSDLREEVRQYMADNGVPYEKYGRTRGQIAEQWGHPLGDDVERYIARQFVENFMISRWVSEVFADDKDLYKAIVTILKDNNVDEAALRDEAKDRIKNLREGTVEYEVALQKSLKEVKKRHGLIL